jgi:hypothetical protein
MSPEVVAAVEPAVEQVLREVHSARGPASVSCEGRDLVGAEKGRRHA